VLTDVYISVIEALKHAAWFCDRAPKLTWIDSEDIEKRGASEILQGFDGVIVPGGFGSRGIEGIISAIRFAREQKIPYLGLCYGMQLAVIEFARNVAGLGDAHTTEVNPQTPHPVIHIMPEQEKKMLAQEYGATMRLGSWPCKLRDKTNSSAAYGALDVSERHRHRYEFNNVYRSQLEVAGLVIAGTTPDDQLVEIIELRDHPFFIGVQFHPEFLSRPFAPHPLFREFIKKAGKIEEEKM
jgi:CTP synthase